MPNRFMGITGEKNAIASAQYHLRFRCGAACCECVENGDARQGRHASICRHAHHSQHAWCINDLCGTQRLDAFISMRTCAPQRVGQAPGSQNGSRHPASWRRMWGEMHHVTVMTTLGADHDAWSVLLRCRRPRKK